jgi:hypothetical protein
MRDTSNTLAKGVNRDMYREKSGAMALRNIPSITGIKTTRAVAEQSAMPLSRTVFPTKSFTKRGVAIAASIVEHDVRRTDNATSALAINDTRFEAVPPGEQPTRARPRNNAGPRTGSASRSIVRPTTKAVAGIIQNWHKTPAGTDAKFLASTSVKSLFSRVIPVPNMTHASIREMISPRLTHSSVEGTRKPAMADPRTKSGKADVSRESMASSFLVSALETFSSDSVLSGIPSPLSEDVYTRPLSCPCAETCEFPGRLT